MLPVDKNIPIPSGKKVNRNQDGRIKHPLRSMEVGDSYFTDISLDAAKQAVHQAKKATGYEYTRRKVIESGVSGYRIWRVS